MVGEVTAVWCLENREGQEFKAGMLRAVTALFCGVSQHQQEDCSAEGLTTDSTSLEVV